MRRLGIILALAGVFGAGSATYGSNFAVHGSYWDTDEADEGLGLGAKFSGSLAKVLELELRGIPESSCR